MRYVENKFSAERVATLSASYFDKPVLIGAGKTVNLAIWVR
jgi:hypothetical protein